jgi:hypothetical protein
MKLLVMKKVGQHLYLVGKFADFLDALLVPLEQQFFLLQLNGQL